MAELSLGTALVHAAYLTYIIGLFLTAVYMLVSSANVINQHTAVRLNGGLLMICLDTILLSGYPLLAYFMPLYASSQ